MKRVMDWLWKIKGWIDRVEATLDPQASCVVCGDELAATEVQRKHCARCWPPYLRNAGPPPPVMPRPLGKATGRGR